MSGQLAPPGGSPPSGWNVEFQPVDPLELIRVQAAVRMQERRERARWFFVLLLALGCVGEFLIGAAIMVWGDEKWDQVKDLLAYGVAPLAAALGVAAGFYFSTHASQ